MCVRERDVIKGVRRKAEAEAGVQTVEWLHYVYRRLAASICWFCIKQGLWHADWEEGALRTPTVSKTAG